jgi:hypothetical protein
MARVAWLMQATDRERETVMAADATPDDRSGIGMGTEAAVLTYFAEGLAAAGQYHHAERAAAAIGPDIVLFSGQAYSAIAEPLAAAGRWDSAQAASDRAGHYRPQALAGMAKAAALTDRERSSALAVEAAAAARSFSDRFWRAKAVSEVAVKIEAIDAGLAVSLAKEAAAAVSDGYTTLRIGQVTEVLTAHGAQDTAEQVTQTLREDPSIQAWAITGLAGAAATNASEETCEDAITHAVELARELSDHPAYLILPLARIARRSAAVCPEQATGLAEQVERAAPDLVGDSRPHMLAYAAAELAAPLPPANVSCRRTFASVSSGLLGSALAERQWYSALPVLGEVDPDGVATIRTALLADWPNR